jgi:hypothetical protein
MIDGNLAVTCLISNDFVWLTNNRPEINEKPPCTQKYIAPYKKSGLIIVKPMMHTTPITGGCYCGKVRFKAKQKPIQQANCHCENCRRAVGAQAVAWITVKRSNFEFEKGHPKRYRTDTGAYRTFCEFCGTSLT